MRKYNLNIAAAVCVLIMTLAVADPAGAVTRYVPSPYPTIQGAIDASAMTGDEIEVAPGTYNEAINFGGKAVRLYSSGGSEVTTIHGNGSGATVQCINGEYLNTILDGFTIMGGALPVGLGAGMYNYQSNPTVTNCRFSGNTALKGGGMYNYQSSPTVTNCTFSGNTAYKGGGMYNNESSPTVVYCTFYKNSTDNGQEGVYPGGAAGNGGDGAGMYNENASPEITNCIFTENSTGNGGTGGEGEYDFFGQAGKGGNGGMGGCGAGIFNISSSPSLKNCTFNLNKTGSGGTGGLGGNTFSGDLGDGGDGGRGGNGTGIYNCYNSSPIVSGCTFDENLTGNGGNGGKNQALTKNPPITGYGGDGGNGAGMCNVGNSTATVSHCQFMGNITGKGGNRQGNSGNGAGIYNYTSSPLIEDCDFIDNKTGDGYSYPAHGGHGGGMFNGNNSSPTVNNCLFQGNRTGNGSNTGKCWTPPNPPQYAGKGGNGAGICNDGSSPVITNCSLTDNITGNGGTGTWVQDFLAFPVPFNGAFGGSGGDGGGMYNTNYASPTITNCIFTSNRTGNGGNGYRGGHTWFGGGGDGGDGGIGGFGAGIYNCDNASPSIYSCTFELNKTGDGGIGGEPGQGWWKGSWGSPGESGVGGGIGNYQSSLVASNCTFRGNSAFLGGGMSNKEATYFIVTNCTFTLNLGKIGGGGIYSGYSIGSPTVTNCIFWDDSPNEIACLTSNVTYSDVKMSSGTFPGTGNINADPMFADDAGRLLAVSDCINAGSNSAPNLPAKDFDGNPRIINTTVDMGAFEFTTFRIRNETKDLLYATIQAAIDNAGDGDEIRVLPGTYNEAIDFKGKAVRLYSTSGPQFTTINGNGAYHVVQCVSGEDPNTILEGFTITGGNANGSSPPDDRGGGIYNYADSNPTVTNCTFSGNSADSGGGMYNNSSNPTVTNCTFSGNTADYESGGMHNEHSSPTVTNCTFSGNTADYEGGGMYNTNSSPTVTNCTFSGNTANYEGGGCCNVYSSSTVTNCTFQYNTADFGSGMCNYYCNPIVTNCTFRHNTADFGSGMCNYRCNPIVTNCILWGDGLNEIYNYESTPIVTYSDVQGGYPGTGNINADPGFSWAMIPGRYECSIFLSSSASPCVDAGDNNAPNLPDTDRGGQPRVIDGDVNGNSTVDMGAYEFQPCVKNVTRNRWYQLIQHSVEDACDYDRIEVSPGTYYESIYLMLAPNNFVLTSIDPNDPNIVEQTIIDAKFGGDVIHFWSQEPSCIVTGFTLTSSVVNPVMNPNLGYGIGSSVGLPTSPTITNCVITNTTGVNFENGTSVMISGCTIRDNFGGVTAGCNAIVEDSTIANNFAIEGIVFYNAVTTSLGNTILRRCVVSGNLCEYAAISCGDNTTIEDCVISDNSGRGISGMSAGKISGCTINNNKEGGISFWAGPIENCTITGNCTLDYFGGGLFHCTGPITGCLIERNEARNGGGLASCSGPITNCIIAANRARSQYGGYGGGGLAWCNGTISNCTIVGNVAWGDPCLPDQGLGGGLYECTGTITNSIIWQNSAQADGDQFYSSSVPSYSCIQDWPGGGVGNIAADPCFVYSGYWADFNDPNTVVEPNDPNAVWVDGYYRLRRGSACIDAGDNNSVPADISDLDADGDVNEPVPFDLVGLPRFIEDLCTVDSDNPGTPGPPVVDMGAYEFLPADIDSSGAVNLYDLSMLALHLGETGCGRCGGANLNCDVKVDFKDLLLLTDWWLAGTKAEL